MTDHSQCRLLLAAEEQPSPGTGSPAPTQAPPRPTAHYRTRHPLQSRSLCAPAGAGSVPVPSSPPHPPPPDKANSPFSRSPACCAPPLFCGSPLP